MNRRRPTDCASLHNTVRREWERESLRGGHLCLRISCQAVRLAATGCHAADGCRSHRPCIRSGANCAWGQALAKLAALFARRLSSAETHDDGICMNCHPGSSCPIHGACCRQQACGLRPAGPCRSCRLPRCWANEKRTCRRKSQKQPAAASPSLIEPAIGLQHCVRGQAGAGRGADEWSSLGPGQPGPRGSHTSALLLVDLVATSGTGSVPCQCIRRRVHTRTQCKMCSPTVSQFIWGHRFPAAADSCRHKTRKIDRSAAVAVAAHLEGIWPKAEALNAYEN